MRFTKNCTYSLPCGEHDEYVHLLLDLEASPTTEEDNRKYLATVLGGHLNVADNLGIDLSEGLPEKRVEEMKQYGRNIYADPVMKPYIAYFLAALNDPILLVLIFAAAFLSLTNVLVQSINAEGFIEGAAIIIAVLVVVLVSSGNDYSKELKFRAVEKLHSAKEKTKVLRSKRVKVIPVTEVVLGDVVVLRAGDQIPADGILWEGKGVRCDESMLTGENCAIEKDVNGLHPFLFSSCLVSEMDCSNVAKMLVIAVGSNCEVSRIHSTLSRRFGWDTTPLENRLNVFCKQIGIVGILFAFVTFMIALIWDVIDYSNGAIERDNLIDNIINDFVNTITIIVVAIPEGLPLAVTISLAHCTMNMYKDNNLIRRLASCETMGNATVIYTDKTGTLTRNQLLVEEGQYEVVLLALKSLLSW